MLRFSSFLVCSVLLLAPAMARAETGSDVMDRVYKQADIFPNSEAEVRLVVKNKKGGERERFFYLRAKNDATTKKSLVKFFKPANVKGVGLASETVLASRDKSQFVYFPSLRSVKKLSTAEQDGSFMGSDFSYSDIAGRTLEQDTHKIFNQNDKFYVVESVPVDAADAYSKYYTTIDKATNIVRAVTFYNRQGDKLKTLSNKKVQMVKGQPIVTVSVMSNHKSGGSSTMERNNINVDVRFDDNDVGLKALKAN